VNDMSQEKKKEKKAHLRGKRRDAGPATRRGREKRRKQETPTGKRKPRHFGGPGRRGRTPPPGRAPRRRRRRLTDATLVAAPPAPTLRQRTREGIPLPTTTHSPRGVESRISPRKGRRLPPL
jgi:hypothetical protein